MDVPLPVSAVAFRDLQVVGQTSLNTSIKKISDQDINERSQSDPSIMAEIMRLVLYWLESADQIIGTDMADNYIGLAFEITLRQGNDCPPETR